MVPIWRIALPCVWCGVFRRDGMHAVLMIVRLVHFEEVGDTNLVYVESDATFYV